jgi:hypothetical protein
VIGGGTATMIGVLASVALLQIRSRRQRASNSESS